MVDLGLVAALSVVVFFSLMFGDAFIASSDRDAYSPSNPQNVDTLAAAVRGGSLPNQYAHLPVDVLELEYAVERSTATDVHTVQATVMHRGESRSVNLWLVTESGGLKSNCGDTSPIDMVPGKIAVVDGCFVLLAGEKPLAALILNQAWRGPFDFSTELYRAAVLPLFAEAPPPGLVCSTSANGTVCLQAAGR